MQLSVSYTTSVPIPEKKWHIIYTRPHHEKNIYRQLQENKIEAYLPLQTTLRQWSDRKKKVTLPLFNCYLFVYISLKEYYWVLNVPGVIRYVCFEGKAAILSEKKIETIKKLVENRFELEEIDQLLQKGQKVKIITGPLTGINGELIFYSNKKRVIIRVEEINKCLTINVPLNNLKLVS